MLNLKEVSNGTVSQFLFEETIPADKMREAVCNSRYFSLSITTRPADQIKVLTKEGLLFATIKLEGNLCKSLLLTKTDIGPKLVNKFERLMSKALAELSKTQRFRETYFTVKIPADVLQKAASTIGCGVETDANSLHINKAGDLIATAEVKNGLCHTIHFQDTPKIMALLKQLKANIVKETFIRKIENTTARKKQEVLLFNRKIRVDDLQRAAEAAGYSITKNDILKKGDETPIAKLVLDGLNCKGTTGWADEAAFSEFNLKLRGALKQAERKPEFKELFDKNEITKINNFKFSYVRDAGTLVVGPTSQVSAPTLIDALSRISETLGQKYAHKDVGGGVHHITWQAEKPLLVMRQGKQDVILLFQNVPQNKKFVLECITQLSKK